MRTRPLFKFDPGWLYLVAGLAICGAGILVPAVDGLRVVESQVLELQGAEQRRLDRVQAYEDFAEAVDRGDEDLVRRLAAAQLNLMPADEVPVFLCTAPATSVTDWIDARVAAKTVSVAPAAVMPPTLLRRLATGPQRLWFLGAGVFCVFLGLIIGSPTAPSPVVVATSRPPAPDDDPAPVAAAATVTAAAPPPALPRAASKRWVDDPAQLSLFDFADTSTVEHAVTEAVAELVDEPEDVQLDAPEPAPETVEEVIIDPVDEVASEEDEDVTTEVDDEAEDDDEHEYVDEADGEEDEEDAGEDEEGDDEYEYVDEEDGDEDDAEEEDAEEEVEYEYVDEDGNPIAPEDLDGWDVQEEEAEETTEAVAVAGADHDDNDKDRDAAP